MNQKNSDKTLARYAATLSLTEIGLGSLLHGLSIPFAGQLLSLNQIAIMSRLSFKEKNKTAAIKISLISSLLKSLSPAGKKLTPMLAILAQGFLYSLSLTIFGLNFMGFFFAVALSAAWAYIQPLILIYFMFGKSILEVFAFFEKEFSILKLLNSTTILYVVLVAYLIKLIASLVISIKILGLTDEEFLAIEKKFIIDQDITKKNNSRYEALNAIYDLLRPIFIFSFLLTGVFVYFSQGSYVQMIWTLLRPLAVGFIVFYVFRIVPLEKFAVWLEKKGQTELARNFSAALKLVKNKKID